MLRARERLTFVLFRKHSDNGSRWPHGGLGKKDRRDDALRGPADRPWGMRTVTFADPGGHIWEIAQEIPGDGS